MTRTFTVGIGGGSGSGKTRLADEIRSRLGSDRVTILNLDRFFRPDTTTHNRPEAIDMDRLRQVVRSLLRGETVELPARKHLPAETVVPRAVTIVEGHLCLCISWLVELLDLRIYVDMDAEERLLRRVQRNVLERGQRLEHVVNWYRKDVILNHRRFIEPSKAVADIILWGEWTERRLVWVVKIVEASLKA